MKSTITKVGDIPKYRHDEAMALAETEYERFADLLTSLSDDEWSTPTDCDRWNVANVTSHLIAMSQMIAAFPVEMVRQQRASKPLIAELGLPKFDAWTEYQAKMHTGGKVLVESYRAHYPRALRRRQRFPKMLRGVRMPQPPYGWWSFTYMLDDILTRDVWMHRVDVSRATGRDLLLTPEHDGRFVANIVRDLGARWDRPFNLTLTGPAGGEYVKGSGGPEIRVDAIEFCRILSGRSQGHGLPTEVVPF
jgi:uncharacterized protein (TIGR03083 family)